MKAVDQMTRLVAAKLKDTNLEIAKLLAHEEHIDPDTVVSVIVGATFGLGVTMMFESGHSKDDIIERVRSILAELMASAADRGAS
jgi:hypothetical protein